MNDEQKTRLATIAREWAMMCQYPTVERDDAHWLLALVKELDEENARLAAIEQRFIRLDHLSAPLTLARCEMLEQQLAAVTVERDELKREVERLEEERILFTGDAARAEAERDMLRAELAEAEWLIEHAPAATLGEPDEMAWLNRESAWSRARELARLKGRT